MSRRFLVIAALGALAVGSMGVRVPAQAPSASAIPVPVGTPTENGLAGFAKILCSAVFISSRDPAEAARNSAYFFMPRAEQDRVTFTVDRDRKLARATFGNTTREARLHGDQGCVIEAPGGLHFTPVPVRTALAD